MQADLEEETQLTFHRTARSNIDSEAERENPDESNDLDENENESENENEEIDENEHDEGDFTFACAIDNEASSIAEEIFHNGKIKPVFPLFDQSLVDLPHQSSSVEGISHNGKIRQVFPSFDQSLVDFPHHLPPVKNVFVGAAGQRGDVDEVMGPVCAWSKKTTDPATAPETCKKSNSTGFSKLWRFKEMSKRSSSDGKDTFVFLNKQAPEKTSQTSFQTPDSVAVVKIEKTTATKTKSGGKGKTTSSAASAHEVYVKSKAASREEDRRRSYLPYKPELVGFFTNVNGGMSKNVHPF